MPSKFSITWFTRAAVGSSAPGSFHEEEHLSEIGPVIDRAREISHEPGFILGQVLSRDGFVLVNVAPDGICVQSPAHQAYEAPTRRRLMLAS